MPSQLDDAPLLGQAAARLPPTTSTPPPATSTATWGTSQTVLAVAHDTLDSQAALQLWSVFSKSKNSLQDGQRLENISWRSAFRDLHTTPPGPWPPTPESVCSDDTKWISTTTCTPFFNIAPRKRRIIRDMTPPGLTQKLTQLQKETKKNEAYPTPASSSSSDSSGSASSSAVCIAVEPPAIQAEVEVPRVVVLTPTPNLTPHPTPPTAPLLAAQPSTPARIPLSSTLSHRPPAFSDNALSYASWGIWPRYLEQQQYYAIDAHKPYVLHTPSPSSSGPSSFPRPTHTHTNSSEQLMSWIAPEDFDPTNPARPSAGGRYTTYPKRQHTNPALVASSFKKNYGSSLSHYPLLCSLHTRPLAPPTHGHPIPHGRCSVLHRVPSPPSPHTATAPTPAPRLQFSAPSRLSNPFASLFGFNSGRTTLQPQQASPPASIHVDGQTGSEQPLDVPAFTLSRRIVR
ncbi:hypothetical protein B0H14DRAFT_3886321 [Mycena olivaceomarginata]|nr:hypothetical protein B0H14DRAFT_3886321 [Mycena olivaceomarginata]